jgi:tetratricopeptide (TPR) repeat protein
MHLEITNWITNPTKENAIILGDWYYGQAQWASALVYYLRATEWEDDINTYYSLLKVALCLMKQGDRFFYAKGVLHHAINLYPKRPEAYHLMSICCERTRDWQDSYTWAELGMIRNYSEDYSNRLKEVEYLGHDGLRFQKAVAGWWMGRENESLEEFYQLYKENNLPHAHIEAIKSNIKMILS